MRVKKIVSVWMLMVLVAACSGGSSENDSRPALVLDSTNASFVAISVLEDVDYFLDVLFDFIAEIDEVATNPGDFEPFSCISGSQISPYFPGASNVSGEVEAGDSFGVDLGACQIGLNTNLTGDILVTLQQVDLNTNSYGGSIRFSDFEEESSGGSISLDGRIDFVEVRVLANLSAMLIEDSLLTVTKYDVPINVVAELYENMDLVWIADDDEFELEIELDVDSEAFGGSFSLQTPVEVERIIGNDYPTVGNFLFEGASRSSYRLTADAMDNITLNQSLDSDGNGEDAVQPATAPTWQELFPEDFLVPIP